MPAPMQYYSCSIRKLELMKLIGIELLGYGAELCYWNLIALIDLATWDLARFNGRACARCQFALIWH